MRILTGWLVGLLVALVLTGSGCSDASKSTAAPLRVGVAAVPITPCGDNPDRNNTTTASDVWGELFEDANGNGRYDTGETFTDDPGNDALDAQSKGKYD